MKKTLTLSLSSILVFAVIYATGCAMQNQALHQSEGASNAPQLNNSAVVASNSSITNDSAKAFSVDFKSEPGQINAGTPAVLSFTIKDRTGETVRNLSIVHEKPVHLLIVSKDLAEFYHLHPEQSTDGTYNVSHNFPNGGEYKLYADFTPKGGTQVVEQIDLRVTGSEREAVPLASDTKLEKTVEGLRVVMKPDGEIKAGQELMLNFQAFDAATGKPATDLQNYLGELAHFVIISEDMRDFVHAHPMSKDEHNKSGAHGAMRMGDNKTGDHNADGHTHQATESVTIKPRVSEVAAHTAFPRAGLYKVWAQFQRAGRVITVPFTIQSAEGKSTAAKNSTVPSDAVKVSISKNGFEPSEVKVEEGSTVKIAFTRTDAENCGGEVIFPAQNIQRKLLVGETVLVEFTSQKSGEISFSCGMDMYKGKVVVN